MHPEHLLGTEEMAMIDIWSAWRAGDGVGHLPFAGGAAEQPACVMAALAVMDGAWHALRRAGRKDGA